MGSTRCTTQIIFTQNEFYTGRKATVKIICDNSQCDKPVKSFKFKLHQRYLGLNQQMNRMTQHQGYVSVVKHPGCPAKTKIEREFEVDLPANVCSDFGPGQSRTRPGASYSGKLFNIEYSLNVFVKHDSWNEFGEGNCVSLPIKVHQSPNFGPFTRVPSDKTVLPTQWNPTKGLKKKFNPDDVKYSFAYLADVIEPELKEWSNMTQPHILTQQELKDQEAENWKKVPELVREFETRMSVGN